MVGEIERRTVCCRRLRLKRAYGLGWTMSCYLGSIRDIKILAICIEYLFIYSGISRSILTTMIKALVHFHALNH